ncbi:ABC transporter ATP-binding protein/permease [Clostridium ihumii]|uniref:ABC transporter ATP-binding protein/permease n=1 Tax=Clostridium ihumii TaxID=1470356 RepID=UPI003D356E88
MMIDKRLINLCKDSKKYVKFTVLVNWISIICNICIIAIIGKVIDDLANLNIVDTKYYMIIALFLIIRFISSLSGGYFSYKASSNVKVTLRDMIYKKLLKLGLNYNEVMSTSSIVQASIEGVEQLEIYFGKYLPQLFYSLIAPLTLFIFISFISIKSAVVFIISVPLIPISIIAIMKIAKKILKKYWGIYSNLGETFLENLQGLTTLKVFNVDDIKHKKMNDEAESFRKITMKVLRMQLNSITIMDLIAFLGASVGSIVAINEFLNGRLTIGAVVVIILLSSEFFIPLRLLGSFFHIAMNGIAASEKIFKLLDAKESQKENLNMQNELCDLNIDIKNINFSYDNEREVIKNVSMKFSKNTFTAIVGKSGSGKSTIASLILNTYKVNDGKILFNSIDIDDLSFDNIYEKITLISTNSYIFNGTILENLLMAKDDATKEEINRALELSNLKGFINTLKDGLHTKTGENGNLLSGGQKQRLALARAILANREVVIFDEATSNIDVESEELILDSINKLSKEKTIIMISHRLENVKKADKIYVMKDGEVVEEGTHNTLINFKNEYYKMIENQKSLERKEAI